MEDDGSNDILSSSPPRQGSTSASAGELGEKGEASPPSRRFEQGVVFRFFEFVASFFCFTPCCYDAHGFGLGN